MSQVHFVRHWLSQLSQAHFTNGRILGECLNPEYIAMVFPRTADEKGGKQQQEKYFCLSFGTVKVNKY
jgi:hypothetical protein